MLPWYPAAMARGAGGAFFASRVHLSRRGCYDAARMARCLGPLVFVALVTACDAGDDAARAPRPTAAPAVSAAPAASAERATAKAERVELDGTGGSRLVGDITVPPAADEKTPVVLMVHRYRGDRGEWQPLVDQLAAHSKPWVSFRFDLPGHGESTRGAKDAALHWGAFDRARVAALADDVLAAARFVRVKRPRASGVVMLGSSLGGAIAATAAANVPGLTAFGIISPGAAIEGVDVYRPVAVLARAPLFFAAAEDDNVAKAPIAALPKMGKADVRTKQYSGAAHGAGLLGSAHPELWTDVVAWLDSVRSQPVLERAWLSDAGSGEAAQGGG